MFLFNYIRIAYLYRIFNVEFFMLSLHKKLYKSQFSKKILIILQIFVSAYQSKISNKKHSKNLMMVQEHNTIKQHPLINSYFPSVSYVLITVDSQIPDTY